MEAPGPPHFLAKDESGSQGQRSRSPVVFSVSLPVPLTATTNGGENLHREVDGVVEQSQAAQVNLLDSPVHKHGFNPPREQETSRGNCLSPPCEQEASGDQFSLPRKQEANGNHLSTPQPKIAEEHSVQPKTNDGSGELILNGRGLTVETRNNGASLWLLSEKPDGTIQYKDVSNIFRH